MRRGRLRRSRAMLATRPDDPRTLRTFEEALTYLEQTHLRPGQTMIRRSRVMAIARDFDTMKAESSVVRDGSYRYLSEGHHTTIASVMVGEPGCAHMGMICNRARVMRNVSWLPRRSSGRVPMTIVE